jgi:hypothetical protein
MESFPHGNLCAALCTSTKTTTKIRKTTDDDRCCEENLFLDCINYVSCSVGACVEHSHEAMSDQIKKIAPFTKLTYSPESELPLFKDLGGGKEEGCISLADFCYASTATVS